MNLSLRPRYLSAPYCLSLVAAALATVTFVCAPAPATAELGPDELLYLALSQIGRHPSGKDYAEALDLLRMASDKGSPAAQLYLGHMRQWGLGTGKDEGQAIKLYERAARSGNPVAMLSLANMFRNGIGVPVDYSRTSQWLDKVGLAAKRGETGSTQQGLYDVILDYYLNLAESGDPAAQHHIATMYVHGVGLKRNLSEAFKWFKKAAEAGYVPSQTNLGVMYERGAGVEQDYSAAVKWLKIAAEAGSSTAQFNLGDLYLAGRGVETDEKQAVRWYARAAAAGLAKAQYELAQMCQQGLHTPRDESKAIDWYYVAACNGHSGALELLKKREMPPLLLRVGSLSLLPRTATPGERVEFSAPVLLANLKIGPNAKPRDKLLEAVFWYGISTNEQPVEKSAPIPFMLPNALELVSRGSLTAPKARGVYTVHAFIEYQGRSATNTAQIRVR